MKFYELSRNQDNMRILVLEALNNNKPINRVLGPTYVMLKLLVTWLRSGWRWLDGPSRALMITVSCSDYKA